MRLFVATEVTEQVRRRAAQVRDRLGRAAGRVRWERPEKLHLTLRFLGDTPEARLPDVCAAVERVAGWAAAVEIGFAGLGVFPDRGMPRVLWIGVNDPGGRLAELAARLEAAAVELGYAPEKRAYKPHLTLARIEFVPGGVDLVGLVPAAEVAEPIVQRVEAISVYQSELKAGGSEYVKLATYELRR